MSLSLSVAVRNALCRAVGALPWGSHTGGPGGICLFLEQQLARLPWGRARVPSAGSKRADVRQLTVRRESFSGSLEVAAYLLGQLPFKLKKEELWGVACSVLLWH